MTVVKITDLKTFDVAEHLDSGQAIAQYLTAVLEEGNPALLAAALGDVARARGMSKVAGDAGVSREALYKALRADAQPRFETIQRVMAALGVRLVAVPVQP
ncbi:putative addiction module antidote protein [Vandammella animalimorsus]|uniref:Putative addiction module antidote protein n=1 Tax=Vandammella animalimorsus TaxID=2029117 RepID=A0A2A2T779_9BURK|nr:putative addiction module antidote protein [Vandammella animalimorsus]PAX17756.1 putative addiction module antidote protein [Vandammella animalimorsus]PAX19910.1 putative addiction module antidote protein [Vandammella animalimorsus]RMX14795.1 putative addiction module antidote protein [Vandammella animalimorsus]RRD66659.1 putative addiction module antidote protein [Comamonadaceae bacterium OH2310_COT-174]